MFTGPFHDVLRQVIMLFTLNLRSAVCQLYLNKTGKKCSFPVRNCLMLSKAGLWEPFQRLVLQSVNCQSVLFVPVTVLHPCEVRDSFIQA